MNFSVAKNQIEKILSQRNGYMMLAIGSMLICMIQCLLMFFMVGRERIVVVPPTIEKSFWVSSSGVSSDYLSEMTRFFVMLRLNVTPDNSAAQRDILLRYTDPSVYGELKSLLVQEADKMQDQHVSLAFYPTKDIQTNTKKLKAMVEGDLKSYVGETALPVKHVKYLVSYRYHTGKLFITSFEEVKS